MAEKWPKSGRKVAKELPKSSRKGAEKGPKIGRKVAEKWPKIASKSTFLTTWFLNVPLLFRKANRSNGNGSKMDRNFIPLIHLVNF